jgi:CRISPR-associated endonuclease/helicase Cas3
MPKPDRFRPFNFGRVFFPGEAKPIPDEIRFQPLGDHVGNVRRLVKWWSVEDFPYECSQSRVLEAADIHDMGKPQRFELLSKTDKFKEYTYSFKGHRFLAKGKDQWAERLAIGHHDFSAKDICRDTYELKKNPKYAELLQRDPLGYARELYILEMCDQIEAELACRVMDDTKQAESRAFMDFTIAPDSSEPATFYLDPWAFDSEKDSIQLTFKYWSMQPNEADRAVLQKCIDEHREQALGKTLDQVVKQWWQSSEGQAAELHEKTITLKPYPSSEQTKHWTAESFYQQIAGWQPNPMQVEMFEALYDPDRKLHPAIVMKSTTGSGKTESVVFPALASGTRLIIPLPARSLLEDQKQRIEKYLKKFSALNPEREFSLVVDTGSRMYRSIYKNGDEIKTKRVSNPRRHLYKGDIILTTLDKFLYRYFAFGDKQKSFTFPLRIHRDRTLICFDEAHSYDEISFTNFQSLVKSLYEAGRSIILMTATLSEQHRDAFDYLDLVDYIDDPERANALKRFQQDTLNQSYINQRGFTWLDTLTRDSENPTPFQDSFTQTILNEWQAKNNRRIIAVVERVTDAAAVYQALKQNLSRNHDDQEQFLFLYHGRIADQVRPDLYEKIQKRDAQALPYLLITTSAIEVGCDLNAEVLLSEICPPENLIQRAGRCNRRGNIPDAKVILIGSSIPDFANSLDVAGWQNYQTVLSSLSTFDSPKIAQCIKQSERIDDYRVVELFSMLHDYIYSADLTCQPTHQRGLIPTRSWIPSVELRYLFSEGDYHSISVPIDRLYKKNGKSYAYVHAYERSYSSDTTKWNKSPLGWGSAYGKNIVIEISSSLDDFIFDRTLPEYPYSQDLADLGFVELPTIFSAKWVQDAEVKLMYKEGERKAIISYIKSID